MQSLFSLISPIPISLLAVYYKWVLCCVQWFLAEKIAWFKFI